MKGTITPIRSKRRVLVEKKSRYVHSLQSMKNWYIQQRNSLGTVFHMLSPN
jgi:hypothetical protein